jgi:membrane protein implicated in regulation of membrane protease activity
MSTLLAIGALVFLNSPWRWIAFICLLLVDVFEIWLWLRMRNRRAISGPEGMVGKQGTATTDLNPNGQARVKGELWTAVAAHPIAAGEPIVVTGVDGIKLLVTGRKGASG